MRLRLFAGATISAVAALTTAATVASPATAADTAKVSVLHGVPGLTVDVFANGKELIPNFTPGSLAGPLSIPAGNYDIQVFKDGEGPGGTPAIEAKGLAVPGGANLTLTANLDTSGKPALNAFKNDTSMLSAGMTRLTVRHVAAAPAVDVRAGGNVVISGLTNPNEKVLNLPAGNVNADVVLAGTSNVAIGPAALNLKAGANTIVYAWGSAADGNLKLATQTISGLGGAPAGMPGGESGAAAITGSPSPLLIGGFGSAFLVLLFTARRRLAAHARS
jgi:hypothetical protein